MGKNNKKPLQFQKASLSDIYTALSCYQCAQQITFSHVKKTINSCFCVNEACANVGCVLRGEILTVLWGVVSQQRRLSGALVGVGIHI